MPKMTDAELDALMEEANAPEAIAWVNQEVAREEALALEAVKEILTVVYQKLHETTGGLCPEAPFMDALLVGIRVLNSKVFPKRPSRRVLHRYMARVSRQRVRHLALAQKVAEEQFRKTLLNFVAKAP